MSSAFFAAKNLEFWQLEINHFVATFMPIKKRSFVASRIKKMKFN